MAIYSSLEDLSPLAYQLHVASMIMSCVMIYIFI